MLLRTGEDPGRSTLLQAQANSSAVHVAPTQPQQPHQADSTAPTADLLRSPERGPHGLLGCSWDLLLHHRLLLLLRLLFVLLLVWLLLPAQHTRHRFISMCAVLRDLSTTLAETAASVSTYFFGGLFSSVARTETARGRAGGGHLEMAGSRPRRGPDAGAIMLVH